uniref:AlNc14C277G10056 protein n=1 Tax=Albugo laibachii Nc14 TaxID=890382 RepID=F0WUP9_9STRA|nr:AlNc14C277G10056 [Albugo laibachii Nc14]CCA25765.1 AlNc14C320G10577 [Albugo laibachii Nc14]|eukprot:CCA25765.1 AlNc14C320G10577 [Albugo laibachii Nc14]
MLSKRPWLFLIAHANSLMTPADHCIIGCMQSSRSLIMDAHCNKSFFCRDVHSPVRRNKVDIELKKRDEENTKQIMRILSVHKSTTGDSKVFLSSLSAISGGSSCWEDYQMPCIQQADTQSASQHDIFANAAIKSSSGRSMDSIKFLLIEVRCSVAAIIRTRSAVKKDYYGRTCVIDCLRASFISYSCLRDHSV